MANKKGKEKATFKEINFLIPVVDILPRFFLIRRTVARARALP